MLIYKINDREYEIVKSCNFIPEDVQDVLYYRIPDDLDLMYEKHVGIIDYLVEAKILKLIK